MRARNFAVHHLRLAAAVTVLVAGYSGPAIPAPRLDTGFEPPERVTLRGYDGEAMEPFITPDGRYLLFNNRNDPAIAADLHVAVRVDDLTFDYRGPLAGANSNALDGVPSVDRDGNLFFISTREGPRGRTTLYRGRFRDGVATEVAPLLGLSSGTPGYLIFDAEIARDGRTLFFAEGEFAGGAVPRSSDIVMALREGDGFRRSTESAALLREINTAGLEYAPAVSEDLLELFFTRVDQGAPPAIYRSTRASAALPFGPPVRLAAIDGFAEAPALSPDGRSVYFHKLDRGRFAIYRVRRRAASARPAE